MQIILSEIYFVSLRKIFISPLFILNISNHFYFYNKNKSG